MKKYFFLLTFPLQYQILITMGSFYGGSKVKQCQGGKFLKSNPKLKRFSKASCRISDGQGVESWYWQEVRSVYFSPETFLAVESVVWIVIEKSSDAPYYCHPAETESFRKRSESHPPTITGLTLPDPRITAAPQSRTFLAHYLKKSTAHFLDGGGRRVDAAWRRGWVGN